MQWRKKIPGKNKFLVLEILETKNAATLSFSERVIEGRTHTFLGKSRDGFHLNVKISSEKERKRVLFAINSMSQKLLETYKQNNTQEIISTLKKEGVCLSV